MRSLAPSRCPDALGILGTCHSCMKTNLPWFLRPDGRMCLCLIMRVPNIRGVKNRNGSATVIKCCCHRRLVVEAATRHEERICRSGGRPILHFPSMTDSGPEWARLPNCKEASHDGLTFAPWMCAVRRIEMVDVVGLSLQLLTHLLEYARIGSCRFEVGPSSQTGFPQSLKRLFRKEESSKLYK